jgi:hypothetical protein
MKYSEAGKGSSPRKNQDRDAFGDGYDRIWGDKKKRQREALEERAREEEKLYDESDDDFGN